MAPSLTIFWKAFYDILVTEQKALMVKCPPAFSRASSTACNLFFDRTVFSSSKEVVLKLTGADIVVVG